MAKPLTPAQVEAEIKRLKESELVKLSQLEQRIKADKRRKYLADLRWHEKHGKMLEAMGLTSKEAIEAYLQEEEEQAESDET